MAGTNDNDTTVNKKARRKILKTITGASGAIAAGGMLPDKWSRPMVDAALLPAHAQTSPTPTCTEPCTLNIELEWYTAYDADLLLETPGGSRIDPKAATTSTCLQHNGDIAGGDQIETITNIGVGVNPGTYRLYVRVYGVNTTAADWTVNGCNIDIDDNDDELPGNGTETLIETFTVPGP